MTALGTEPARRQRSSNNANPHPHASKTARIGLADHKNPDADRDFSIVPLSGRFPEAITDTPYRLNRIAQRTQLFPKAENRIVNGAIAGKVSLSPDRIQQVAAAERSTWVAQEQM
jgi:hypothetical protein